MNPQLVRLEAAPYPADLAARVLAGELFVLRGCMQGLDLFEELRAASLEGIRSATSAAVAERVEREGFEALHRIVDATQIPRITDEVYHVVKRRAPSWLEKIVRGALGVTSRFFFERQPNVRFMVPYELSVTPRKAFKEFARTHGDGKITPHGPHRDGWLDCPVNALNVWIAVGPVLTGNGLSIFPAVYGSDIEHSDTGEIARDARIGAPVNFDLAPGDMLIFHGQQIHASELNQTDMTRHVVSFRLTLDKPDFPHGHYHHYVHSALQGGALHALAEIPANLSWSYVDTRIRWAGRKLAALLGNGIRVRGSLADSESRVAGAQESELSLDATSLAVGSLVPVSARVCIARLEDGSVVAFDRRCPHEGGDLALGSIRDGRIVCPLHNLALDPSSGESSCKAIRRLRLYPTRVDADRVTIMVGSRTH